MALREERHTTESEVEVVRNAVNSAYGDTHHSDTTKPPVS